MASLPLALKCAGLWRWYFCPSLVAMHQGRRAHLECLCVVGQARLQTGLLPTAPPAPLSCSCIHLWLVFMPQLPRLSPYFPPHFKPYLLQEVPLTSLVCPGLDSWCQPGPHSARGRVSGMEPEHPGPKGLYSWPGATLLTNQAPVWGPSVSICRIRLLPMLSISRGTCHNCWKCVQFFSAPLAWSRCPHHQWGLSGTLGPIPFNSEQLKSFVQGHSLTLPPQSTASAGRWVLTCLSTPRIPDDGTR